MDRRALVVLCAVVALVVTVTVVIDRWLPGSPDHHDFIVVEVASPNEDPTLGQPQLLTKRLVSLAAAKARAYWGGTRCGTVTFDYRPLAGRRVAEASWSAYSNSNEYLNCRVTFSRDPTKVKTTFWRYCSAVVHEFGHLSGHGHSRNPRSIMYTALSNLNVPATCKRL